MAITGFQKNIWEARLLANFHDVSIADAITTKPSSTDGATVKFNKVGAGSVGDYSGSISWTAASTTAVDLTFTQKKYFGIKVDDVDSVTLAGDVLDATVKEYSDLISEAADTYVIGKAIAGVASGNKIGASGSLKTITKVTEAYDYIVDLGTLLGQAKVPTSERFVVVNNAYLNLLQKDSRFTLNPEVLANGIVNNAKINGMTVVVSEEVPAGRVVALHKSALGFGRQLDELEALRLQDSFSDAVRGLVVYDSVVLRDTAISVLFYTVSLA